MGRAEAPATKVRIPVQLDVPCLCYQAEVASSALEEVLQNDGNVEKNTEGASQIPFTRVAYVTGQRQRRLIINYAFQVTT